MKCMLHAAMTVFLQKEEDVSTSIPKIEQLHGKT